MIKADSFGKMDCAPYDALLVKNLSEYEELTKVKNELNALQLEVAELTEQNNAAKGLATQLAPFLQSNFDADT